jgi:leucyl aminopeptidase
MDIAGVAFGDSEYTSQKSATGFGIRLLIDYIAHNIK